MTARPADFTPATRSALERRAAYQCSHPECDRVTIGPGPGPDDVRTSGIAGHVYSASENGPRGAGGLSVDERKHISNGIWLCDLHGRIIDGQKGADYSPSLLMSWRDLHEARTAWRFAGITVPLGWLERLTIGRFPAISGGAQLAHQSLVFSKCTLITGNSAVGKTAVVDALLAPLEPDRAYRWTREGALVEATIRCYLPAKREIHYAADSAGISWTVDGFAVSLTSYPLQVVRPVLGEPWRGDDEISRLAEKLNEAPGAVPGLVRAIAGLPGGYFEAGEMRDGDPKVRWNGRWHGLGDLSGGQEDRLLLDLAMISANARALQGPTILVLDTPLGNMDRHVLADAFRLLHSPDNRFQVIATHFDDGPARGLGWEVIHLAPGSRPAQRASIATGQAGAGFMGG